jgi:hypothetical protein
MDARSVLDLVPDRLTTVGRVRRTSERQRARGATSLGDGGVLRDV